MARLHNFVTKEEFNMVELAKELTQLKFVFLYAIKYNFNKHIKIKGDLASHVNVMKYQFFFDYDFMFQSRTLEQKGRSLWKKVIVNMIPHNTLLRIIFLDEKFNIDKIDNFYFDFKLKKLYYNYNVAFIETVTKNPSVVFDGMFNEPEWDDLEYDERLDHTISGLYDLGFWYSFWLLLFYPIYLFVVTSMYFFGL